MLQINDEISLPESEIRLSAIRARGPGGQNVNKVSSAIQLQFDILSSATLPDDVKNRLLQKRDRRITAAGVVNIRAERSRSRDKNRVDALNRLRILIRSALHEPRPRKKTRPGSKQKEKRLADKAHRARLKQARSKVTD